MPGHFPGSAIEGKLIVQGDLMVLEQRQQGGKLEGRARLGGADGVVEIFPIAAIGLKAEVSDRLDLAGGHFHDDAGAMLGLIGDHFAKECVLRNILDIDVQGSDDILSVLGFDLIAFDGDIGAAGDIADEAAARLAFQQGVIGAFETYVLGIRSCQANGTIGQQAERIQSFVDHFRDKTAFITAFTDKGELAKLLVFFERNVGGDLVIAVFATIALPKYLPVGGGRLVTEKPGQAKGKGVDIPGEPAAVLFAKAIGAKVDIDIEIRDGSARACCCLR